MSTTQPRMRQTTNHAALRAAIIAVAMTVLLAVTGCGSGDDDKPAAAESTSASQADGSSGGAGGDNATDGSDPNGDPLTTGSDKEQVATLLEDLQATYIDGDGAKYCSMLTAGGRGLVEEFARALRRKQTCAQFIAQTSRETREAKIEQKPTKLLKVRIKGNRAIATVSDGGRPPQPMVFVKRNGQWKLPDPGFKEALTPQKPDKDAPQIPPRPNSQSG